MQPLPGAKRRAFYADRAETVAIHHRTTVGKEQRGNAGHSREGESELTADETVAAPCTGGA
jgi:hypothetical protein